MSTGQWKIIISGVNVAVQRIINLTLVTPSTVTITVRCPLDILKCRYNKSNSTETIGYTHRDRGDYKHA